MISGPAEKMMEAEAMSQRVFGLTATTPGEPERLLTAEVTFERADLGIAKALGALLTEHLPELPPGASISVYFRRGDEAADALTSTASLAINVPGQDRAAWDFTVAPDQIEPEEVPL